MGFPLKPVGSRGLSSLLYFLLKSVESCGGWKGKIKEVGGQELELYSSLLKDHFKKNLLALVCLRYSADYDELEYFKSKNSFKKSAETIWLCK